MHPHPFENPKSVKHHKI